MGRDEPTLFAVTGDQVSLTSDDCYTPRWVFDAMGLRFDLDVAAPVGGPWYVPCDRYFTAVEDGLTQPWEGVVWCNPPYSGFDAWATRWAVHDRGALMGLVATRQPWRNLVYRAADAVYVGQVVFSRYDGKLVRFGWTASFVAFRGVGVGPAERLAAADPFGGELYGRR